MPSRIGLPILHDTLWLTPVMSRRIKEDFNNTTAIFDNTSNTRLTLFPWLTYPSDEVSLPVLCRASTDVSDPPKIL